MHSGEFMFRGLHQLDFGQLTFDHHFRPTHISQNYICKIIIKITLGTVTKTELDHFGKNRA